MTNVNCLQNITCPKCGCADRFFICATITAEVTDEGADIASSPRGDIEWDDENRIECPECGATGTVGEFSGRQSREQPGPTAYTAYRLAPDEATYGTDAGRFIVTRGDHEQEVSGPMAQRDAESFAAALSACRMVVNRWEKGDLAAAARACSAAVTQTARRTVPGPSHTITIQVLGGVVQDVSNVPPGWCYQIVDHDDLESDGR